MRAVSKQQLHFEDGVCDEIFSRALRRMIARAEQRGVRPEYILFYLLEHLDSYTIGKLDRTALTAVTDHACRITYALSGADIPLKNLLGGKLRTVPKKMRRTK